MVYRRSPPVYLEQLHLGCDVEAGNHAEAGNRAEAGYDVGAAKGRANVWVRGGASFSMR